MSINYTWLDSDQSNVLRVEGDFSDCCAALGVDEFSEDSAKVNWCDSIDRARFYGAQISEVEEVEWRDAE